MFSKKQRLNTSQFDEVFNFGKEKRTDVFLVKYKENKLDLSRFSIVVPKKVEKFSVKRHFLKRKFISTLKKSNILKNKKDFVFILNKNIKNKKEEDIILTINNLQLE